MMELLFLGPFVPFPGTNGPWNIRSLDRSFPGHSRERIILRTFLPWTIRSLERLFRRPDVTWNIPALDYDRSNTKLILYIKWS